MPGYSDREKQELRRLSRSELIERKESIDDALDDIYEELNDLYEERRLEEERAYNNNTDYEEDDPYEDFFFYGSLRAKNGYLPAVFMKECTLHEGTDCCLYKKKSPYAAIDEYQHRRDEENDDGGFGEGRIGELEYFSRDYAAMKHFLEEEISRR